MSGEAFGIHDATAGSWKIQLVGNCLPGPVRIREAYWVAAMLPMIATPSAPPSSRTVSFTAEPTPARAVGSVAMIRSVAGAMAMPAPRPNSRRPIPVGV